MTQQPMRKRAADDLEPETEVLEHEEAAQNTAPVVTNQDLAKKVIEEGLPEWAKGLTKYLDDVIKIPGTNLGLGLDSILGFIVPGAGDAATGVGSVALLFLALKHRVPTVVLGKMLMNIGVDVLGGIVPVIGDAFDVVWRSNRRNLELVEAYQSDPDKKPKAVDYLLVWGGVALAILSVLTPMIIGGMFWATIVAFVMKMLGS